MEGTELLELRYVTKLSCALKTLPKAFDRTQSSKGMPQVQKNASIILDHLC